METRGDAPSSVTYSYTAPMAISKSGMDQCGKDGWGWNDGEQINSINYGMFSLHTNYSHAGNAVRVTIDNETGAIIGNPTEPSPPASAAAPR